MEIGNWKRCKAKERMLTMNKATEFALDGIFHLYFHISIDTMYMLKVLVSQ